MLLSFFYFAIFAHQCASSSLTNWLPWQGNSAYFSCDPFLDCQTVGIGIKVPDPEYCNNYYLCVNSTGESVPTNVSITCPSGEYFSHSLKTCVIEYTPCINECFKFCNLECNTSYQFVAYPGDCSKYYFCYTMDIKIEMDCPLIDPYFDGHQCTKNPYQCCDSCIPYCSQSFIEIEDPLDCQSFYICEGTGVPSEDNHAQCPDGEHFNSTTNRCVIGTECISICNNSSTTLVSDTIPTSFETTDIDNTGPAKLL